MELLVVILEGEWLCTLHATVVGCHTVGAGPTTSRIAAIKQIRDMFFHLCPVNVQVCRAYGFVVCELCSSIEIKRFEWGYGIVIFSW